MKLTSMKLIELSTDGWTFRNIGVNWPQKIINTAIVQVNTVITLEILQLASENNPIYTVYKWNFQFQPIPDQLAYIHQLLG